MGGAGTCRHRRRPSGRQPHGPVHRHHESLAVGSLDLEYVTRAVVLHPHAEAERLTNAKAYEEFGAHKVYGRIPAGNESAKKAVIYNGWQQEGVMRRHVRHGDELVDVEIWGGFPEDAPEPPED